MICIYTYAVSVSLVRKPLPGDFRGKGYVPFSVVAGGFFVCDLYSLLYLALHSSVCRLF